MTSARFILKSTVNRFDVEVTGDIGDRESITVIIPYVKRSFKLELFESLLKDLTEIADEIKKINEPSASVERVVTTINSRGRADSVIKYLHGQKFTGTIKDRRVSGTICVEDGRIFFCTDNPYFKGSSCDNKMGHKYSWVYDGNVDSFDVALPVNISNINNKISTFYSKLTKKVFYEPKVTDSHIKIGCQTFSIVEFQSLYNNIVKEFGLEDEMVSLKKSDVEKLVKAMEALSTDIFSFGEVLSSIKLSLNPKIETVTKRDAVKSGPARDAFGRFIKTH